MTTHAMPRPGEAAWPAWGQPTSAKARRVARRVARWLALLVAHALLALLLQQALRPPRAARPAAGASTPGLLWLDLRQATRPAPPPLAATTTPTAALYRPSRPPPALKLDPPVQVPAPSPARPSARRHEPAPEALAITAPPAIAEPRPAPSDEHARGAAQGPTAPTAREASPIDRPLNLALPRGPARAASTPPAAWASQDPRTRSDQTASERFAQALGTAQELRVQDLNGGARRWRRGSECVETRPAREAQINPMGSQSAHLPHQASGC